MYWLTNIALLKTYYIVPWQMTLVPTGNEQMRLSLG